jgi:hypothetical protein
MCHVIDNSDLKLAKHNNSELVFFVVNPRIVLRQLSCTTDTWDTPKDLCVPCPLHDRIRHALELLWRSYQPIAKTSTCTGQHSIKTQRQTSVPRAAFEPTIPVNQAAAVPWLRRLVARFSLLSPGFAPCQSMWDLWWTNRHCDRFFPRVLRFSLSISFHRRSPYFYISSLGMNNMSVSSSGSET